MEFSNEIKLEFLNEFKDNLLKIKNIYENHVMVDINIKYNIKIPNDLLNLIDFLNLIDKKDNEPIKEKKENKDNFNNKTEKDSDLSNNNIKNDFINVLIEFILKSQKAILSRNDFTLFYKNGKLEYLNKDREYSYYNIKTIFIDLGTVLKVYPKGITKYIFNVWFRLNNLLCILGIFEAKNVKNSKELLEQTIEAPQTLFSIVDDFTNLIKTSIENLKSDNLPESTDRTYLTTSIKNIISNDIFDKIMTIILYADLNYIHIKMIIRPFIDYFETFLFLFNNSPKIQKMLQIIFKNKNEVIENLIIPYKDYFSNDHCAKLINITKYINDQLSDDILNENIRNYIKGLSIDNINTYKSYFMNLADSLGTSNPMNIENVVQQKVVKKVVRK